MSTEHLKISPAHFPSSVLQQYRDYIPREFQVAYDVLRKSFSNQSFSDRKTRETSEWSTIYSMAAQQLPDPKISKYLLPLIPSPQQWRFSAVAQLTPDQEAYRDTLMEF